MINVTLDNGAELTYCELGQDHQEILVTTAFYFHTFMSVVEELAKRFHVYALIMRFDGTTDELNADGDAANKPEFQKYAPSPELIWDSLEDCDKALKNMTVPVGYCFGTRFPAEDHDESRSQTERSEGITDRLTISQKMCNFANKRNRNL